MVIRKAKEQDIDSLLVLLKEVHRLHAAKRPDIFKKRRQKYTKEDLMKILEDEERPIYVAEDKKVIAGYIFCIYQEIKNHQSLSDIKTLYIDDLCVKKEYRKKHVGTSLYNYAKTMAKVNKCNNITLNVWNFNKNAYAFYSSLGLMPLKTTLEERLEEGNN